MKPGKTHKNFSFLILALIFLSLACWQSAPPPSSPATVTAQPVAATLPSTMLPPTSSKPSIELPTITIPPTTNIPPQFPFIIDCTADNPACPPIQIAGDGPDTLANGERASFSGFSDPSLRRDPVIGRLWMAYSWPSVHEINSRSQVPAVDIHLAYSDDNGLTWIYHSNLWPAIPGVDPDGEEGFVDSEVANLLPVQLPQGLVWFGVRLDYFLPTQGGYRARKSSSFHLKISQANNAPELANTPTATLGSVLTEPGWGVDFNLASLAPELSKCMMWNEPALHYQAGELYLAVRCLAFIGNKYPDPAQSDLVIFAARPQGDVKSWQWRYVGVLAGAAEAQELGGVGVTQIDFALGKDGKLLVLFSPDNWTKELDWIHFGCRVLEVASITVPALERDSQGRLIVRAVITATDLDPIGPGACAYDPAATTGVMIMRRNKATGQILASIHATGIFP